VRASQPGIVQDVVIRLHDRLGRLRQSRSRSAHQIARAGSATSSARRLSCSQGMRLAIAVSEDTDPYSMDDIMWCMTTRVNPRTDILNPIPGGRGQTFMPAERMTAVTSSGPQSNTQFEGGNGHRCHGAIRLPRAGLSCGRSIRSTGSSPEDFFTKKDIENAKSRMVGWVHSLARHRTLTRHHTAWAPLRAPGGCFAIRVAC